MRVLLINPASPYSFWSFDEICRMSGRRSLIPPLGLLTAAALLPRRWELRLADMSARPVAEADWQFAEVVFLTGMLLQKKSLLELVVEAKRRGKTVVVGGPFVTSLPEEVRAAGADVIVQGEGEETIPVLAVDLEQGAARRLYRAEGRPAMAASPVPRFDLLRMGDYATMSVQTSRGCPHDCEFCDIVNLYGKKPRYKSPGQVVAELDELYRLGWRNEVFFCDDNFIGNKRHARDLLDALIPWMQERSEPFGFWTQASVDLGQDTELMDRMTAANFSTVFIGVESPDPAILERNHKLQNVKNPLAESLRAINENGLSIIASFIMGFDGEEPGAGDRIVEFVEEVGLPQAMINLMQVLPNTRLWTRMEEEGRLRKGVTTGDTVGLPLNYEPLRDTSELLREYQDAWRRLYDPAAFLGRLERYYTRMRPTRSAMPANDSQSTSASRGALSAHAHAPAHPRRVRPLSNYGGLHRRNPIRHLYFDVLAFLRLFWTFGVLSEARKVCWAGMGRIWRTNGSRLVPYFHGLALGYNTTCYVRALEHRLEEYLARVGEPPSVR